jgi:leader peptidase (prepilin peptidase)/N-methyltransferase
MDFFNSLPLSEVEQPWPPLWVLELVAKVLLGIWLFFFGACVGSFLNVVIYRLPRGMSLVHPGSRCPTCGHAIRGWDNIPLVSWLLLRGKCRDCSAPISPRYYYVELTVGLVFLLTAIVEAFAGGRRSLYLPSEMYDGRPLLQMHDGLPFWLAYVTHVVLLTTLIGAALIDSDGFCPPWRLFAPTLAIGLGLPILDPQIRRLPLDRDLVLPAWQAGLMDGLAGLSAGVFLGLVAGGGWWIGSRGRHWPRSAPVLVLGAVGLIVGWQRIVEIAPSSLIAVAALLGVLRLCGANYSVPLAAIAGIIAWPRLVELDSETHHTVNWGEHWPAAMIVGMGCLTAAVAAAMGALSPPNAIEQGPTTTTADGSPTAPLPESPSASPSS